MGRIAKNQFSGREMEVLQLVALGMSNKQMRDHLDVKLDTVQEHVSNIRKKLMSREHPRWTRDELAQYARTIRMRRVELSQQIAVSGIRINQWHSRKKY